MMHGPTNIKPIPLIHTYMYYGHLRIPWAHNLTQDISDEMFLNILIEYAVLHLQLTSQR